MRTRYGSVELGPLALREKINEATGTMLVRIDALKGLEPWLGKNALEDRERVYHLIAGDLPEEEYKKLLLSYYTRFLTFQDYIDTQCMFGDRNIPLVQRVVQPLLDKLSEHRTKLLTSIYKNNGQFLAESREYLYASFNKRYVPDIEGGVRICSNREF